MPKLITTWVFSTETRYIAQHQFGYHRVCLTLSSNCRVWYRSVWSAMRSVSRWARSRETLVKIDFSLLIVSHFDTLLLYLWWSLSILVHQISLKLVIHCWKTSINLIRNGESCSKVNSTRSLGNPRSLFSLRKKLTQLLSYQSWRNERDVNKVIRVGYLSPDFFTHSVSYFAESLLANHSKDKFRIYW